MRAGAGWPTRSETRPPPLPRPGRTRSPARHAGAGSGDYANGSCCSRMLPAPIATPVDRKGIGHTYSSLGAVALDRGELERAREPPGGRECALLREVGDEHELAGALDNLADLALNTGDFARARLRSPPRRSGSIAGEARRTEPRSRCSTRRSPPCTPARTMRRARSSRRASASSQAVGDLEGVIYCLEAFAALAQRRGEARNGRHACSAPPRSSPESNV